MNTIGLYAGHLGLKDAQRAMRTTKATAALMADFLRVDPLKGFMDVELLSAFLARDSAHIWSRKPTAEYTRNILLGLSQTNWTEVDPSAYKITIDFTPVSADELGSGTTRALRFELGFASLSYTTRVNQVFNHLLERLHDVPGLDAHSGFYDEPYALRPR